jgi:hypothetical protein
VLLREGDDVLVEIERRTARSSGGKKLSSGSTDMERITPPAIRKPKAWIG